MKIEIQNGSFWYNQNDYIFNNLSFHIHEGEILSILGPNGCGKTTLLKCLVGIHNFVQGNIFYDESLLTNANNRSRLFGYVPQISSSPLSYSVFQMVLLGRSKFIGTFSKPSSNDIQIVERIIKDVGIAHLSHRPFSSLSGGEKQMVLICRALATEAKILAFDEPTSALDLINQHTIIDLMYKLSKEMGLTIIFSTHTPTHALHISDKTLLMHKNAAFHFGETQMMVTEKRIYSLFGVETKIVNVTGSNGNKNRAVIPLLNNTIQEKRQVVR